MKLQQLASGGVWWFCFFHNQVIYICWLLNDPGLQERCFDLSLILHRIFFDGYIHLFIQLLVDHSHSWSLNPKDHPSHYYSTILLYWTYRILTFYSLERNRGRVRVSTCTCRFTVKVLDCMADGGFLPKCTAFPASFMCVRPMLGMKSSLSLQCSISIFSHWCFPQQVSHTSYPTLIPAFWRTQMNAACVWWGMLFS